MRRLIFLLFLLSFSLAGLAQKGEISRKEIRRQKEAQKAELVQSVLSSKTFIFIATHALPLGGSSIFLTSSHDMKIKNDSAFVYLPYFGVAYQVEYGGNGGFEFNEPVLDYQSELTKNGTGIRFEVKTKRDFFKFRLTVSDLGYATLQVTSNNRQPIQFFGTIDEEEKTKSQVP